METLGASKNVGIKIQTKCKDKHPGTSRNSGVSFLSTWSEKCHCCVHTGFDSRIENIVVKLTEVRC